MPCTLSNNEQNLYCIFHVWQGEKNHWSILLPITKSLGIIFKIVIHATRNNLPNQPTMHMHQLTLLAFHAHASNENKFDACVHTTRINLHFNWTFIFPVRTLGLRHINQQRWSSWKNGSVERRENKKKPAYYHPPSEKQQKSVRRCVKRSAWGERDFCTRTRPIRATNFRRPPRGGRAGGCRR